MDTGQVATAWRILRSERAQKIPVIAMPVKNADGRYLLRVNTRTRLVAHRTSLTCQVKMKVP